MKKKFFLALGVTLFLAFLSFNMNIIKTKSLNVTLSDLISSPKAVAEDPVDWCNDWCYSCGYVCVLMTNVGFPLYCYGWDEPF